MVEEKKTKIEEIEKEGIRKFLIGIEPRDYQWNIFETASKHNTLVVLPTGLGKTLIALMLAIKRLQECPESKIVFLAPTKPLVEQHFNYFKKHLPEIFSTMTLFTGKVKAEKRKELWKNSDIIFSTPQCISNDIENNFYDLKEVSLLIEDECHRCTRNYAYTFIAKKYKEQAKNTLILGLTASPGSNKEKINEICKNLGIEKVEIRTREDNDVKEYIQKLNFEIIKLDFPKEFKEIRDELKKIYDKKVEELKNRKLLFNRPTKKNLLELQHRIMRAIATGNRHFNILAGASACALAIKIQHALELLETQTLASFFSYMQDLFEQANNGKSKAVKQLVKTREFNKAYTTTIELIAKKIEHPKLLKLKEIVEEEFGKNEKTRIIVFCQYRDSVVKITKELNSIPNVNARVFVGQAKKGETGLSQKEQQQIIKEFALGKINILVATSIGEEGLDLPEVNAVIFYEPIPSAIRKIQRAGRTARVKPGKLIILVTRKTRDESYYWAAFHKERRMYKEIKNINKNLQEKKRQKNLLEFKNGD